MDNNEQKKRIDFTNSNLSWGGSSRGIFKLASVLTVQKNGGYTKTFGLGLGVLAGNMYVEKKLLKQPPYLFQVAGSISEQYIFRTLIPIRNKLKLPSWLNNDKTRGTCDETLLKEFNLDIRNESANVVTGYDDIETSFTRNCFSAKIHFNLGDHSACMEFPIHHINIKPQMRLWQIETGPVLFPIINEVDSSFVYSPSFIHFNDFDKLDVFYDYPYGVRSVNLQGKDINDDISCTIELYSN